MHPAAMEEHGGQQSQFRRYHSEFVGQGCGAEQHRRNGSQGKDQPAPSVIRTEQVEEYQDAGADDGHRHILEPDADQQVIILDGKQGHARLLAVTARQTGPGPDQGENMG